MKKFIIIFTFLTIFFNIFPQEKAENQDKSYYQINTKYFQIIYQPKSLETATIIAENADRIYEEIAKKLGTETNLSLPVLIRSDIQALNAYFSSYPYNRIVIYDTVPDSQNLAVFSETILSVFYHELTHAVSLNMKSKPWEIVSFLFGDFFSPTVLTSPTMFSEGATVSFESAFGEGRLNSGYAKNILVQAKLENNLPDWKEASGANDKYRVGDYPYIFGGAFHQFLQEKYGLEKYSELWKELGSTHLFTESAFKKVYGTKLKDEWKLFLETIPLLPVVESNQIELTKKDNITCFDVVNDNVYYFSKVDKGIFLLENDNLTKIMNTTSVVDLAISPNERFLAITKLSLNLQYETFVYDLEKKQYLKGSLVGVRLPQFTKINSKLYLIGLTSLQNQEAFVSYEISENTILTSDSMKEYSTESFNKVYFSELEVFDFTLSKNQNFITVLAKKDSSWVFGKLNIKNLSKISTLDSMLLDDVLTFPANIIPLSINYVSDSEYLINYVEKDYSLPRVAKLVGNNICFQQEDISGGIQNPIKTESGYVFLNQMLNFNTISVLEEIPGGFSNPITLKYYSENLKNKFYDFLNSQNIEKSNFDIEKNSTKYSNWKHLDKFAIIPLFSNFDLTNELFLSSKSALGLPGFTLLWQNPLENQTVGLGFGYLSDTINSHISYTFIGFLDSTIVLTGVFENLKKNGFQFSESNISLSLSKNFIIPKKDLQVGLDFDYLYYLPVNLKTAHIADLKIDLSGMYTSVGFGFYTEKIFGSQVFFTPNLYGKLNIPRLLPFSSPFGFTLNLPVKFGASLCKDSTSFLTFDTELTLFSAEIQKSVPFIPLYINRFSVTSGYFLRFNNKKIQSFSFDNFQEKITNLDNTTNKVQGFSASAFFELTPVVGNLVNIHPKFGVDFVYYLDNPFENESRYKITIAGMFTF